MDVEMRNDFVRRTRGLILSALFMLKTQFVALRPIQESLHRRDCPATMDEIRTELCYLAGEEKRYVVFSKSGEAAKLTPRGIDLMERSIPVDPGVDLDA